MIIYVSERERKLGGKGENDGHTLFSNAFFLRVIKILDCVVKHDSTFTSISIVLIGKVQIL